MPKKIEEYLYILSPTRAYLNAVKIMGPIVHPLYVSKKAVTRLLMSGAEVYEYIPKTKNTIKLTLSNINNSNRYNNVETSVEVVPPVETIVKPGVTITPVQPQVETPAPVETAEKSSEEVSTTTDSNDVTSFITFEYNEDGTIDESNIVWTSYTMNQRKAIRAYINANNEQVMNATK